MSPSYLFVYGTLRLGASADLSLQYPDAVRWITKGWVHGHLYRVSYYPGLVLPLQGKSQVSGLPQCATANRVIGDIFEVLTPAELIPCLDDFEACSERFEPPHEYVRQKMDVFVEGAAPLSAWVYLYNLDTEGLAPIFSGDFLDSKEEKTRPIP